MFKIGDLVSFTITELVNDKWHQIYETGIITEILNRGFCRILNAESELYYRHTSQLTTGRKND